MTQIAVSSISGRGDVEQEEIEHRVDALGAALDDLGHAAGAPLEVEAQRQIVEVAEHPRRPAAGRLLADLLEQRIAQIVDQHAGEARGGISGDQRQRRASTPPSSRSSRRPPICSAYGTVRPIALPASTSSKATTTRALSSASPFGHSNGRKRRMV